MAEPTEETKPLDIEIAELLEAHALTLYNEANCEITKAQLGLRIDAAHLRRAHGYHEHWLEHVARQSVALESIAASLKVLIGGKGVG